MGETGVEKLEWLSGEVCFPAHVFVPESAVYSRGIR